MYLWYLLATAYNVCDDMIHMPMLSDLVCEYVHMYVCIHIKTCMKK